MPLSAADLLPGVSAKPTRWSAAVFAGKAAVLRLRRGIRNVVAAERRLQRHTQAVVGEAQATSRSPLWSDPRLAETRHQLGKVQNLRRAAAILDGVLIPAGRTFSFWRQLGQASRARGFVAGRMLQQGCVVPAIGGGLCQLSNALYDAALQAGCEIVERHAHSRRVPGSAAVQGRDATVAWNYVDLRFRPTRTLRLSVWLTAEELVVGLHGATEAALPGAPVPDERPQAQSCDACSETGCFRHGRAPDGGAGQQAILVDEAWPEFTRHVAAIRRSIAASACRCRLCGAGPAGMPGARRGSTASAPPPSQRCGAAWRCAGPPRARDSAGRRRMAPHAWHRPWHRC